MQMVALHVESSSEKLLVPSGALIHHLYFYLTIKKTSNCILIGSTCSNSENNNEETHPAARTRGDNKYTESWLSVSLEG